MLTRFIIFKFISFYIIIYYATFFSPTNYILIIWWNTKFSACRANNQFFMLKCLQQFSLSNVPNLDWMISARRNEILIIRSKLQTSNRIRMRIIKFHNGLEWFVGPQFDWIVMACRYRSFSPRQGHIINFTKCCIWTNLSSSHSAPSFDGAVHRRSENFLCGKNKFSWSDNVLMSWKSLLTLEFASTRK